MPVCPAAQKSKKMRKCDGPLGRFDGAETAFRQASDCNPALREALLGNLSDARQRAKAGLNLSISRDLEFGTAFALASRSVGQASRK
jgi:hypothetical protein